MTLITGVQPYDGTPLDSAYLCSFTSLVYDGSGTLPPIRSMERVTLLGQFFLLIWMGMVTMSRAPSEVSLELK
jgi:hypothetical protein